MPRIVSTRPNDIRIDNKVISAAAISTSLSSDAALKGEIKTALETKEVKDGKWDLYVHIYDRISIMLGILMCRQGLPVEPDWWREDEHRG